VFFLWLHKLVCRDARDTRNAKRGAVFLTEVVTLKSREATGVALAKQTFD